jgi:hypothetical protein
VADRFGQQKPNPAVAIEERARMDFLKLMQALALPYDETEEVAPVRLSNGRYAEKPGP